jgi:hypothetical protein
MHRSFSFRLALMAGFVMAAGPALAQDSGQLEDNLSAYIGRNAEGYLGPLRDGVGGALNSGLFMYPGVPEDGFHIRLDARAGVVMYKDEDRTFTATTEESFGVEQTVEAPTVVGSTESITVTDPGTGARYTFPGGFDIDNFGLVAPQLTVGSLVGTELMGRFITAEPEDWEVRKIELWGIGARHSVNHWFKNLPVDASIHVMYQNLKIDDTLVDASAIRFGGAFGKTFGLLAGYVGVAYNSIDMDAEYESDAGGVEDDRIVVDLEKKSSVDLGVGATLKLGFLHLNGEYHLSERNSYALGIGLGI